MPDLERRSVDGGNPIKRMRRYSKVAIFSCLVNLVLVVTKYYLGEASGSLALKADAIHSFADVISSVTIFLGIIIANRKTKIFPEGLYKVENLVALFSSFFIFYAAYEIASQALWETSPLEIEHVAQVTSGIIFIIVATALFSRYELRIGLEVGSPSLVADAKHVSTDILASTVILFGILATYLGYPIDRYVALLVAVLVAHIGVQILIEAVKVLLDATLDYPTLDGIRKILENRDDVKEILSIGGRNSGRFKFVEISLTTDLKLLSEAHEHTSQIEEEILDLNPNIDKILIHYEPEHKAIEYIAAPLDVADGDSPDQKSGLSEHFGETPYFAIIERSSSLKTVSIKSYQKNTFKDLERKKGVKAAEMLAELEVDEVRTPITLEGKGSGYALEALQIRIVTTPAKTLEDLLTELTQELH
ncbi:MAG: cation diffusion facilitator family transporter [Deltaproteobacteria bacterium]|nr:cation diffusion facilitator family transporter [Deltaproteobacteria bacterium]